MSRTADPYAQNKHSFTWTNGASDPPRAPAHSAPLANHLLWMGSEVKTAHLALALGMEKMLPRQPSPSLVHLPGPFKKSLKVNGLSPASKEEPRVLRWPDPGHQPVMPVFLGMWESLIQSPSSRQSHQA